MAEQTSRLKLTRWGAIVQVDFTDRKILDELCIMEIQEELNRLVDSEPNARLVLCFRNVDHLTSAALGMLITLNKRVREKNGRLRLSDIKSQLLEIFKITRLNKLFEIFDTAQEARASF